MPITLNVLLSFAQFEREVIGERVRDKVAASKKRGMWMGGNIPSGYIVENRHMIPDPQDAEKVRYIFNRYLELGSVKRLMKDLEKKGVTTKLRTSKRGHEKGGCHYSRGALYHLLRNPIFIGKVKHKGNVYDGLHEPIIAQEIWDQVQEKLAIQSAIPRGTAKIKSDQYLLKGKIFDAPGNHYSPSSTNKNGKRYIYYVGQAAIQHKNITDSPVRLPAYEFEGTIERAVKSRILELLDLDSGDDIFLSNESLLSAVAKVVIKKSDLDIHISSRILGHDITEIITIPFVLKRQGYGTVIVQSKDQEKKVNSPLDLSPDELSRLVQGVVWRNEHFYGLSISQIANREGVSDTFVGKLIHASLVN